MPNTLTATHLRKRYKARTVVREVSLSVDTGEIVGLLGPNGAGKTTSFYMLVGLFAPDAGEIFIDKTNITQLPIHQRARMGMAYLPQEKSIFRKMTVQENILAILELRKEMSKRQRQERLQSLLQEFHIEHLRDVSAISLSGGEARRVEIARARAVDAHFILLDEPFAGIDPISIIDIKRIVIRLRQQGMGVLITDHNVRDTLDICQRAYIVNDGTIIASGTPSEILSHQQVRTVYLGEDFSL